MRRFLATQATDSVIVHVSALLEDLIPEFLEQQKDDVKTMIAACGQGDYETTWPLGHHMKCAGAELWWPFDISRKSAPRWRCN